MCCVVDGLTRDEVCMVCCVVVGQSCSYVCILWCFDVFVIGLSCSLGVDCRCVKLWSTGVFVVLCWCWFKLSCMCIYLMLCHSYVFIGAVL